jgi:hypothetical protein
MAVPTLPQPLETATLTAAPRCRHILSVMQLKYTRATATSTPSSSASAWIGNEWWRSAHTAVQGHQPPNGTDCESRTLRGQPFETFIGAINMHILHRAMIGGLEPGKEPGKRGLCGVHAYSPIGNKTTLCSRGYAVYLDLAKNGLYFSPRFELAVSTSKATHDGVKMSAGNQQCALPAGFYHITGSWIHCLSSDDIMEGKISWTLLDDWHPEYELRTRKGPRDEDQEHPVTIFTRLVLCQKKTCSVIQVVWSSMTSDNNW